MFVSVCALLGVVYGYKLNTRTRVRGHTIEALDPDAGELCVRALCRVSQVRWQGGCVTDMLVFS